MAPTEKQTSGKKQRDFWSRRSVTPAVAAALLGLVGFQLSATGREAMGAAAEGERLERMQRSPQWGDGHFEDVLPRVEPDLWKATRSWFFDGSEHSVPHAPIDFLERSGSDFAALPASGLRITWLGHSTLIVELDAARLLVDPVWGDYAGPFSWIGPKRFFPPPLPFVELPSIDAVVISHDHYDHLDYPTIVQLKKLDVPFLMPLGIGAHLEHWGIQSDRIVELDWWEEHTIGDLTLVATPARHFSGRSLTDREQTLWAGWAMIGPKHRVFYTGDTGMFPGFRDIGKRLGPFDATMVESGAYNALWADVHLGPEQAVQAHRMLGGGVMIPVHWGLFDLALHSWTEPIERVLAAAEPHDVEVITPRPGQSFELSSVPERHWWPDVPGETAAQAPVVSSALEDANISAD